MSVNFWVAVTLGWPLDFFVVAVTVKVKVPGETCLVFGVPDSTPLLRSLRPFGSEPILFHLYGVAPPVA